MPKKRIDKSKSLKKLEKSVTEILIAQDAGLKPYIHSFHYEPENIAHQPLGTLLGVFEVEDRSKDSAYIVNFLASVVKKEYLIHPKRAAIESLEAALHKTNLALSELIKHDNTAWLGKLNAAICVLEKNNLHFSVAGKAKALLVRNQVLTDIGEGLVEETEPHPLKTFTDVASGRLKPEDKILLTTPELFEVLSIEELKKNVQRLPRERFAQFLKTALVNRLPLAGTLIIDTFEPIPEKEEVVISEPHQEPVVFNAFSQSAFQSRKPSLHPTPTDQPPTETEEESQKEYTDNKTGHIYVQGEETPEIKENETWTHIKWVLEERLLQAFDAFQKTSARQRKNISHLLKKGASGTLTLLESASMTVSKNIKYASQQTLFRIRETLKKIPSTPSDELQHSKNLPQDSSFSYRFAQSSSQKIPVTPAPPPKPSVQDIPRTLPQTPSQEKSWALRVQQRYRQIQVPKPSSSETATIAPATAPVLANTLKQLRSLALQTLPHFTRMKQAFQKLSPRYKAYALGAVACMIVAPLLFLSWERKSQTQDLSASSKTETSASVTTPPLANEKNVRPIENITSLTRQEQSVKILLLRNTPYLVTQTTIVSLGNSVALSFPLPEHAGTVTKAVAMEDLNAIFLLTNSGKIFSFTPSNRAFTENAITLPSASAVADLATYLTYLYVVDTQNNTIYRYPRATEGGFGEKVTWLKEAPSLTPRTTIAINENLYLAQEEELLAFSQGKKVPLSLEEPTLPLHLTQIFTHSEAKHLYLLDTTHQRLLKYTPTGSLVSQYTHEKLGQTLNIAVDETSGTVYGATNTEVFSFSL
jgi:hypothetical protein